MEGKLKTESETRTGERIPFCPVNSEQNLTVSCSFKGNLLNKSKSREGEREEGQGGEGKRENCSEL